MAQKMRPEAAAVGGRGSLPPRNYWTALFESKDLLENRLRLFAIRHWAANYILSQTEVKDYLFLCSSLQLDAPSDVYNLRRVARLAVRQICREYFRCLLSLVRWKKNDRCRDWDRFDSFRYWASARQFADFFRSRLDQRLFTASARSRPIALDNPIVSARCRPCSHLRDHSTGTRKSPC